MLQLGEETVEVEVGGRFQVNSVGMFRRLATLDLGVALLPVEMAAEDLAAGRLRRILPEWQTSSAPVYALTEARLLPAKTLRFIEFLRQRLARRISAWGSWAVPLHAGKSRSVSLQTGACEFGARYQFFRASHMKRIAVTEAPAFIWPQRVAMRQTRRR
jgi:hypothetical protein